MLVNIITSVVKCVTLIAICVYTLHWVKTNMISKKDEAKAEIITQVKESHTSMSNEFSWLNKRLDIIDHKQNETLDILKNIVNIGKNYDLKR